MNQYKEPNTSASETAEVEQILPKIPKYRSFRIFPVINAFFFAEELPLIEARILKIDQMKLVEELLKILPPLSADFNHLKRINQKQILININDENGSNEEIIEKIKCILKGQPEIYCRKVPRCKPQTKRQFEFAKKYWPVSFHKNIVLEKKLDGTNFSKNELEAISTLFKQAELRNVAIIFNLNEQKIICEAKSNPANLLSHPIMECINILSEKQLYSDGNKKQYYATDFDAIVAEEPCTMCAMALVHCRVKRVFFGKLNRKHGALSSKWRLQDSPSLNHHFEVYQIIENK